MRRHLTFTSLVGCVGWALGSLASAQAVHIVSGGIVQSFGSVQLAVDAASEGDAILVAEGTYQPFRIDGKSLSVFAMPSAIVNVDQGAAWFAVEVNGLGPEQRVVLSGLRVSNAHGWGAPYRTLSLSQNAGYVYAQDCEFEFPGGNIFDPGCWEFDGAFGALITDSDRVAFSDCFFHGGGGSYSDQWCSENYGTDSGEGGPGLLCVRSRVALQRCSVFGGEGGEGDTGLRPGGYGLDLQDSEVFCLDTQVSGGPMGAPGWGGGIPGSAAAFLDGTSVLHYIESAFLGGLGVPMGPDFGGPGLVHSIPGVARGLEAGVVSSWTNPGNATFHGVQGDRLWMLTSLDPKYRVLVPIGILHLTLSFPLSPPVGFVPASGSLSVPLNFGSLTSSSAPGPVAIQGFAVGGSNRKLSGARHMLAFDPTSGPDCNGNGVNDYLDIVSGTSPDANHNLIPDECTGG